MLIEDCIARDASDAGIYVGQSENIIVRRNRAEHNVAGIEIENSINADVYENIATDNTGGILVFSLPDLPKKVGRHCRVYNNQIVENNHPNFAPKGNTVASVPAGTGVMIMANRARRGVRQQDRKQSERGPVDLSATWSRGKPYEQDDGYDPLLRGDLRPRQQVRRRRRQAERRAWASCSAMAGGEKTLPDIVYDGVIDPKKAVDGKLPDDLAIRIRNNGDADFVNFDLPHLDLEQSRGDAKAGTSARDLKPVRRRACRS